MSALCITNTMDTKKDSSRSVKVLENKTYDWVHDRIRKERKHLRWGGGGGTPTTVDCNVFTESQAFQW